MNDFASPADRAFAELVAKAEADLSVLGLFLYGSHAFEGMATPHSDYDVGVILDDSEQGRLWQDQKTPELDLHPTSFEGFRSWALDGPHWPCGGERWDDTERYMAAHTRVLIDRLDGQLTAAVQEAATFPAGSLEVLPRMLDSYLNFLYRSLKSWRDDRPLEAHLDAAASIDLALWTIFAMHQRVCPPNKYLRWELQRRPFDTERWDTTRLLSRVKRILADGDPDTQRSLFHDIESTGRTRGLGETIDGWGTDLKLIHGNS
jgi:hypothetical protein